MSEKDTQTEDLEETVRAFGVFLIEELHSKVTAMHKKLEDIEKKLQQKFHIIQSNKSRKITYIIYSRSTAPAADINRGSPF